MKNHHKPSKRGINSGSFFYIYKKEDLKLIKEGIKEGCGIDAPGSFISWLVNKTTIYAYHMPGKRYDIGNIESYKNVQEMYEGVKNGL